MKYSREQGFLYYKEHQGTLKANILLHHFEVISKNKQSSGMSQVNQSANRIWDSYPPQKVFPSICKFLDASLSLMAMSMNAPARHKPKEINLL